MMLIRLSALFIGFVGLIVSTEAYAAPQCAPRMNVLTTLAERFEETRRGMGLAANNTLMELFASEQSGSWTITITLADGTTCIVASGQTFETVVDQPAVTGDPA